MAGPQPYDSTTTLTYLIYGADSIINNNDGLQAAMAVLLFVVMLVVSLLQLAGVGQAGALCVRCAVAGDATTMYDRPAGWRAVGRYGLLVVVSVLVLFPVYTTVVAALKPGNKVLQQPAGPRRLHARRAARGVDRRPLRALHGQLDRRRGARDGRPDRDVGAVRRTPSPCSSSPAARCCSSLFLATLLVPFEATVVVNRRTVDSLGWLNTYQGLAVPFLATAFGTFLIRQVFLTLPRDLRDAAAIDGVGHVGFLRHVAVPLVRPTIGALALFTFLSSWNQYLWPEPHHDRVRHEHGAESG